MRKTKIIATAGPACSDVGTLLAMIRAGMNVVRLNLSHGDYIRHGETVQAIREAARLARAHVAILADTRGIEVRTGLLENGPVMLEAGQAFSLFTEHRPGNREGVSISFPKLPEEVNPGDVILLDDAAIELKVVSCAVGKIDCQVVHGGLLGERKGVNLPGIKLSVSALSPEFRKQLDQEIDFAVNHSVDYLAASFVQSGQEVEHIRELLRQQDSNIPIIAKIENRAGVENIEAIIAAADGIMVARGDLGVELPLADVPGTQKRLIRDTVMNGKPVITATQMLASMESSPKPTRAEASDVANAILDGTSAVMLSGETAVGKYPVQSVSTMAAIALRAEASLREFGFLQTIRLGAADKIAEAVGQAAARLAEQLQATAILTLTDSGYTARLISKHRPECPIIAVTGDESVARRLAMNWGVLPLLYTGEDISDSERTRFGCQLARQLGYLESGDTVVVTHGTRTGQGGTDLIRVITVDSEA
ncbi:MAG: pyruvate kinase [Pseudomonadales bacterium]|nr:pyruvate kinase [Pseudomonadales bacterium]